MTNDESRMTGVLDDPATYERLDPAGIGGRFLDLSRGVRDGVDLGAGADLALVASRLDGVSRVVIAGMGGSAIGGELIRGWAESAAATVPIISWRDYGLPSWADTHTLVLAVSVSGNTAETRAALSEAARRGVPAVAIGGAGEMREEANEMALPYVALDYAHEPRAGLGFTFGTPLAVLRQLGFVPDFEADLERALCQVDACASAWGLHVPVDHNLAKHLALQLAGAQPPHSPQPTTHNPIPAIFAAQHLTGVAMRWKTQINENADAPAFWDSLPEANHNTVQGLAVGGARNLFALLLDSEHYPPDIRKRVDITRDLLDDAGVPARVIALEEEATSAPAFEATAPGRGQSRSARGSDPALIRERQPASDSDAGSPPASGSGSGSSAGRGPDSVLADILAYTLLGDLVSYYLAILLERDPSATESLAAVKEWMG